jgi:leukotriene-A4 hydrolase
MHSLGKITCLGLVTSPRNVTCHMLQVRCKWLLLCIGAEDSAALEGALLFAREQGRMKFVRPLYKALYKSKMGRRAALDQFQRVSMSYHPICEKMVASDLKLGGAAGS